MSPFKKPETYELSMKPRSKEECYKETIGFVEILLGRELTEKETAVIVSLFEVGESRRRFPLYFHEEVQK